MAEQKIIGLEKYTFSEIIAQVRNHFSLLNEEFVLEGLDFSIDSIVPFGSRVFGKPRKDSDLDIKIEYTGSVREDDLFNALNAEDARLYFEGIPVDFFPVKLTV